MDQEKHVLSFEFLQLSRKYLYFASCYMMKKNHPWKKLKTVKAEVLSFEIRQGHRMIFFFRKLQ